MSNDKHWRYLEGDSVATLPVLTTGPPPATPTPSVPTVLKTHLLMAAIIKSCCSGCACGHIRQHIDCNANAVYPPCHKEEQMTPSPLTFTQRQCGQRQPTAQVIALWQSPTGSSGLSEMPQPSMVTSLTSPPPVASGTRKGRPARELHRATRTLLTCCGGGRGQQQHGKVGEG